MHEDQGMVDVGGKPETRRTATAESIVGMSPSTLEAIQTGQVPKGNVLETAKTAAILAAKRTPELLPHCHPIRMDCVRVSFLMGDGKVITRVVAVATDRTGVEMEALTAASVAALTIYDMCKGIDDTLIIEEVRLLEKTGGTKKT